MNCPTLGKVPGVCQDELQIKATKGGVTYLLKTRFRKRYTGSKQCAVDINGKLYLNASELEKVVKGEKSEGKKKGGRGPGDPPKSTVSVMQVTHCFSTTQNQLLTITPNLSPKPVRERVDCEYRVNKKEVRGRLLSYLNTMQGKKELYFWTVTFPAGTLDDIAYKIFNIWLTSLRKHRMLRDYLWIAERQDGKRNDYKQATNTVHFHIAIPHRMPVQRANAMMQGTLKTFAKRGDIPFTVHQCRRYNGVDIAKNRKTGRVVNFAIKKGSRALANYLTKYVTKNDGGFSHLAWHNSRGYSSLFTGVTFTINEFTRFGFSPFLDRTNIIDIGDFAKFIPWREGPPPLFADHLYQLNSYIQSLLN